MGAAQPAPRGLGAVQHRRPPRRERARSASPCGLVTASLAISNWTELDVWRYIEAEGLEVPSIYFAHEREVFERDGMLFAVSEFSRPNGSTTFTERVRYRTVGDLTVTGAVRSEAADFNAILSETAASTTTERGATRADDRTSSAAMEDRKREGYF